MAEKLEYIDMISEATRQNRRKTTPRVIDTAPHVKEASRLSHWPPEHWAQWRAENLTPWRLKSWKVRDWD
jgi:hypothetical protein